MLDSLLNKVVGLEVVFSYEYCEIFKNTYFEEHLQTAASSSENISSYFIPKGLLVFSGGIKLEFLMFSLR